MSQVDEASVEHKEMPPVATAPLSNEAMVPLAELRAAQGRIRGMLWAVIPAIAMGVVSTFSLLIFLDQLTLYVFAAFVVSLGVAWIVLANWTLPAKLTSLVLFLCVAASPNVIQTLLGDDAFDFSLLTSIFDIVGSLLVLTCVCAFPVGLPRLAGLRLNNTSRVADFGNSTADNWKRRLLYGNVGTSSGGNQFTLRTLLCWTIIVAILAAIARSNEQLKSFPDYVEVNWQFYGAIWLALLSVNVSSIWAIFRQGRAWWSWIVPLLLAVATTLGLFAMNDSWDEEAYAISFVCTLATIQLLLILNIFRQAGYRLVRVTRKNAVSSNSELANVNQLPEGTHVAAE
ncbi:MAG: hypothetical protein SGJ20_11655 [Planctomycetota bacterium]|nr:hypothetical protein [Planctomycetota bacterium]